MQKKYPWGGCGTCLDITGCRFFIAPMCDSYVDKILSAVKRVNTQKIWSETDATSTVYRGKRIHVVDCAKACFQAAYDKNTHMVMEATFSKGCPGDIDGDSFLSEDDVLLNNFPEQFEVISKFAFYPLGLTDYMDHIAWVVNTAIERGLYEKSSHYASILRGGVNELFAYFNDVMAYAESHLPHYVLEATLSVNSPTKEKV